MYIFHNFISLTKTNVTRLPSLTLSPIQALWLVESVSRGSSSGKGINFVVWEKYLQLGRDQTRSKTSLQPDQPACLAWPASLPSLTSQPACLPALLPVFQTLLPTGASQSDRLALPDRFVLSVYFFWGSKFGNNVVLVKSSIFFIIEQPTCFGELSFL